MTEEKGSQITDGIFEALSNLWKAVKQYAAEVTILNSNELWCSIISPRTKTFTDIKESQRSLSDKLSNLYRKAQYLCEIMKNYAFLSDGSIDLDKFKRMADSDRLYSSIGDLHPKIDMNDMKEIECSVERELKSFSGVKDVPTAPPAPSANPPALIIISDNKVTTTSTSRV